VKILVGLVCAEGSSSECFTQTTGNNVNTEMLNVNRTVRWAALRHGEREASS
jgi:hypothetical protein